MVDKTPWLTAQGITSYDLNNMPKDVEKGLAWLAAAILGSTGTVVTEFEASQTSSPSLSINLTQGQIYQLANTDTNPIGTLPADDTQILQQGFALAQTIALNTSGLSGGQSKYWLIQVAFEQVDQVRVGDPTGGDRGFYNSADPIDPLDGVDGLGGVVPTVRLGFANVTAIAGVAATSGSNIPPNPSSGCTPLFLINVSEGQTEITNGDIQIAGPLVYSGYPQAPFLAGLLNSHHNGSLGQAPPINLVTETQGILPAAQCGSAPILGTVNPNGNVGGTLSQSYVNTSTGILYVCTTAGTSSTAVWTATAAPSTGPAVVHVTAFPATASGAYTTYMLDATSGAGVVNMEAASSSTANTSITCTKVDSTANSLTLTCAGSDKFIYGSGTPAATLTLNNRGDSVTMQPIVISGQGYLVVI